MAILNIFVQILFSLKEKRDTERYGEVKGQYDRGRERDRQDRQRHR